jgi:curved DNA-binding protein CbpA
MNNLDLHKHFAVLELKPGASLEQIKASYKELVQIWHPDRFQNNPQLQQRAHLKLQQINNSYDFLRENYNPDDISEDSEIDQPKISCLNQLRDALLRCKFCGPAPILLKIDFKKANLVSQLRDGYYVYHLSHSLGGQHLYITSIPKSKDFNLSYKSIAMSYFGALLGRNEILDIVHQLRE